MIRILIVDDEQIIADGLYYHILRRQHESLDVYRVYTAADALTLLESAAFDILLADISMPEMDGLALLEHARRLWPELRVVFITGFDSFTYAYQALQHEGVSYLLKTEGYDVIWERVQREMEIIRENQRLKTRAEGFATAHQILRLNDYFLRLLSRSETPEDLRELQTLLPGLDPGQASILLYGQVTGPIEGRREALEEAFSRYLCPDFLLGFGLLDSEFMAVLQWKKDHLRPASFSGVYFEAMLEKLQHTLRKAHGLSLSLVLQSFSAIDGQVSVALHTLRTMYQRHLSEADGPFLLAARDADHSASWAVRRVQRYITENLDQDLSLLRLASVVHFNPSYLSRLFHRQTGVKLQDYINNWRLERAAELLRHSPYQVQEIAQRCGYGSPKYFAKLFRQRYEVSPQLWREQTEKGQ